MTTFSGELSFGHNAFSFSVPADTGSIALQGHTEKKGLIYVYLYDPQGRIRANILFEKSEKRLVISRESASLGGFKGEIAAGEWRLHVYRMEGERRATEALPYHIQIEFDAPPLDIGVPTAPSLDSDNRIIFDYDAEKNPATRWYRGDLHAHSVLSDGHNAIDAVVDIVARQQLDFFFLTEHNSCHPDLPLMENTLILPGIEITTDLGHFNVHGPARGLDMNGLAYSSEALIARGLAMVGDGLGAISINHPMMKPWHWLYRDMPLSRVNTLEVCCDPTWSTSPQAADDALRVLSAMWNAGRRIAAVGGSDSHLTPSERNPNATEPSIYGDPSTFVYAQGLSGNGILRGLRRGNVYIERGCGLDFAINDGAVLPGEDVGGGMVDYRLAVTDTARRYIAECIVDGECVASYPLERQPVRFSLDLGRRAWARIDIRRVGDDGRRNEFEALINPVYNGRSALFERPKAQTWGELLEMMNRHEI
ncbi:CehA/McbA family metallohydrolase [Brenneria izadpanahii]|uniref:CehA/McbA family metallohydrolase n=1 Tax=Brenneria izadpanahii TaxID=2722756 RepID=A0ABX7UX05_9GAMM|nr:CehA/McbA family metallohydrolase [Brenneria izadpanahii]QTF08690.1 CehA/McbA family metallohydrolase [Brenneria izadpanahii]